MDEWTREERRHEERRREARVNGNGRGDWIEGLPMWARAVALIGLPGTLCFFFLWIGWKDVREVRSLVQAVDAHVLQSQDTLKEYVRAQQQSDADQSKLLRWICSNTAKSDEERRRCFD